MDKLEAIKKLRKEIGGCFGSTDGIFMGHPNDSERAKDLRNYAVRNDVTLLEMQDIITGYLCRKILKIERPTMEVFVSELKKSFDFFSQKLI